MDETSSADVAIPFSADECGRRSVKMPTKLRNFNADSREMRPDSREKRLDSREKRLDSREKRPDSREKRPDSREKRLDSREKRPDSREKRPDSREVIQVSYYFGKLKHLHKKSCNLLSSRV